METPYDSEILKSSKPSGSEGRKTSRHFDALENNLCLTLFGDLDILLSRSAVNAAMNCLRNSPKAPLEGTCNMTGKNYPFVDPEIGDMASSP